MTLARVRDWLELIGLFSVVLSLLFVGLEIKQSQEIAIAAEYQARAEHLLSIYELEYQNDESMAARGQRIRSYLEVATADGELSLPRDLWENLSDEALGREALVCDLHAKYFENLHLQRELGMIEDEQWQAFRKTLQSYVSGGCSGSFSGLAPYFPGSFNALVSELREAAAVN